MCKLSYGEFDDYNMHHSVYIIIIIIHILCEFIWFLSYDWHLATAINKMTKKKYQYIELSVCL